MTFLQTIYKAKFYINVAKGQISWVTGVLPEVVSIGVLIKFFGGNVTKTGVLMISPLIVIGLILFGYLWKRSGLFDTEIYVNASKNPVESELLAAARKINEKR